MDATDRQLMIERLQREADEGRERIAERIARRERNPHAVQEMLLADARITKDEGDLHFSDPIGEPLVQRNDAARGLVYKRHENPLPPAPAPEPEPSGDDPSFEEAVDRFAAAVENRLADLDAELADFAIALDELEGDIRELKGMLGATLQLLGQQQKPKLWKP